MSLWTPDGEHQVPGRDELSPEDAARAEAIAEEMAEVREQLLAVPAALVVANHAMGLYELAAIHLSNQPPNLAEARIAIDAFGALVETVGAELGDDAATLRDALAQIRMAFVQIQGSVGEDATAAES